MSHGFFIITTILEKEEPEYTILVLYLLVVVLLNLKTKSLASPCSVYPVTSATPLSSDNYKF
jgi:hypothetical protein